MKKLQMGAKSVNLKVIKNVSYKLGKKSPNVFKREGALNPVTSPVFCRKVLISDIKYIDRVPYFH